MRSTTRRRALIAWTALVTTLGARAQGAPAAGDAWAAMRDGAIVLLRHAQAPGVGDPPGFKLADCGTQRNLDDAGRAQARRIGDAFRARGVRVGEVWTSQWCRTRETATLAFPDRAVKDAPAFNSFFNAHDDAPARTAAAREQLLRWRGPGVLVVVTHQVNISALVEHGTASGEGVVLRPTRGRLERVASVAPAGG